MHARLIKHVIIIYSIRRSKLQKLTCPIKVEVLPKLKLEFKSSIGENNYCIKELAKILEYFCVNFSWTLNSNRTIKLSTVCFLAVFKLMTVPI